MKKNLLLSLVMMFLPIVASQADVEIDGLFYNLDIDNKTAEVSGYYSNSLNYRFPEEINIPASVAYNGIDYSVTSIEEKAFLVNYYYSGHNDLKSITIPNSVTTIGDEAFSGNYGLMNVTIGNSVTSIGHRAFKDCRSLTSVTIPNSVTHIGSYAFDGCISLANVNFGSSVTSIESTAFEGTAWYNNLPNGLTYVGKIAYKFVENEPKDTCIVLKEGTLKINDNAFSGCSSLISVDIPNSVTTIGKSAFQDCYNLSSIAIPNSVTSIGFNAFQGTAWYNNLPNGLIYVGKYAYTYKGTMPPNTNVELEEGTLGIVDNAFSKSSGLANIYIPNSVISIGKGAFSGCSNLVRVDIPNSVTSIGSGAFYGCSILTDVTIGNSVTDIEDYTFYECHSLKSISIPNSVVSIGKSAFRGCSSLTSITIPNLNSLGDWAFEYCEGITSIIIGNSVTSIGSGAFYACRSLTSITIPKTVTSIGSEAFEFCGLTSITIPNTVTSIESKTFYGCSSLTNISIPNTVTIIGSEAFRDCILLKDVTLPKSLVTIGSESFAGCDGLKNVDIPDNVTDIGYDAFSGCNSLEYVTIGNSVEEIGACAFQNCNSLKSVSGGSSVREIGRAAFKGCNSLSSFILSEKIKSIGEEAFRRCSRLTSFVIPDSVSRIEALTFEGCSSLLSISIGNSVRWIKPDAFENCKSLLAVTIPNSTEYIDGFAFENCDSLSSIFIGKGVNRIASNAFRGCSNLASIAVDANNTTYDSRDNCNAIIETESNKLILGCSKTIIPNSVTSIGEYSFMGCNGLTSVEIPNSVTYIQSSAFQGCSYLSTVFSFIDEPFVVSNVFEGIPDDAILYVPDYALTAYQETEGWNSFKTILPMGNTASISLEVKGENGQELTDGVNIIWYDADGREMGTGKSLNGIETGTEMYYSVTLGEELGRVYREVNMRKVVAEEGETQTCQLEKIGRLTLEGRVSATDIDKNSLTVNVRQMLNSKYPQNYTTQTNEQGEFSVEVYDDELDVIISGDGYLDASLHRDGFNGNGYIGTIPVSLISGFAVAANITMKAAVKEGETEAITAWTDALNNIDFTLDNKTKGVVITDFTVQNGSVVIKTGAEIGDEISLLAKSKQGIFADAVTTFTIEDGNNSFDLQLTELGGLDATCTASNNGSTVGYLYYGNGNLAAKGSYVGETMSLRHLTSGYYTLVSMGNSMLLGSMTRLADIAASGMKEGTDYVATSVTVADGELAAVSVSEVPRLNEEKFYYTSNETYFNASKPSVTAGNYITLQAHIDFKPEYASRADGVTLTIDLPDGCEMVERSAIANSKAVTYTKSGNRVTMRLGKELYGSQVRFCIVPTLNQNYTVTAMAQFDIDGEVTQPIGTAQFEVKGLSLNVIERTGNTIITINGTAKGHSEVSIYDNDVLIGKTSSKADGSWTAQCELYKPYTHSYHDIYAKTTTENGMELTTETRQVEYDKNMLVPEKVTMLYYNPEFVGQYNIVFDLVNGTTTPSSYYYFPYKNWPDWYVTRETEPKDFTFLADFTRNDTIVIKNVNIKVLNSDGTVRTLPATFDDKRGKWVATTKYSSTSRLPKNVTVEYDLIPSEFSDEEREEALQEQANVLAFCASAIGNFFDNKTEMTLVEEEEDYALFECRTSQDAAPMYYRIETLDYHVADDMMKEKQFVYSESEDNIIGTYTEITDGGVTVYVVDVLNNAAFKMSLYENTVSGARANANAGKNEAIEDAIKALKESVYSGRSLAGFLEHFGNLVDLLTGIKEYWGVFRGDFNNMCNVILNYSDNLEQVNKRTFDMTLAKCPDGSYRLSKEDMDKFYKAIQATANSESAFMEQYYLCLKEYKSKLGISVMTFVGTLGLGKALNSLATSTKFVSKTAKLWLYKNLNKHFSSYVFRSTSAKILNSVIGTGIGAAVGWGTEKLDEIFSYKDFRGVRDRTLSWASSEYSGFLKNYVELQKAIKRDYKKCEKDMDDEEEKNDELTDDKSDFKGNGTTPIIDPSGFVYEAVLSNRLEGVTTTCYQQEGGSAILWNAADYSQQNPLKTDETGFYRWDVPQGRWQVKYEKEGYETAYSDWLPVPPPQLDVNIGMKQSIPPTVTKMRGTESGITIDMSKYMLPSTMKGNNITITHKGSAVKGTVEMMNAEQAPLSGETYVQKVKFMPQSRFHVGDEVVVTVHKEVESYCGVKMTADHVETVKIESEIESIVADSVVTVSYQGEKEMRVLVLPKSASAGRKLHIDISSSMIASVSATDIEIDEDGAATLTLSGELPGGAVLSFSVDDTDMTATSKVKVVIGRDIVDTPKASILSGENVERGTLIELICETEGATIYYTLDGSCPCDESSRLEYTGPIVIMDNVTVKAIAVRSGLDDSDVANFIYIVNKQLMGDVDRNKVVDVADIVLTIKHILGEKEQITDTIELMDMNGDGLINVGDVILMVKTIMEQGNVVNVPVMARGEAENIDLTKYTAMQLTMNVPAGARIRDIRLTGDNNSSHRLMYQQKDAERYTVVVYSMSNQTFKPVSGCLLEVDMEGEGEPTTANVLLATPAGERTFISSLPIGTVTGISIVGADQIAIGSVYDLRGNKVLDRGASMKRLPKGVYIMNGKKIIR